VMPMAVNRDYGDMASQKGSVIDVPIPADATTEAVVPSGTPPTPGENTPTSAQITLDQWRKSDFVLTDKDLMQVMNGTIPLVASAAIEALAGYVNAYIFSKYIKVPYAVGVLGTTPYASTTAVAAAARRVLFQNKCPRSNLRHVIDPTAEENATQLTNFQDFSKSGDLAVITEGQIGRKLGMDWMADQQVPVHTVGTSSGTYVVNGAHPVGSTAIAVITGTGTYKAGDIITFAGSTVPYTILTDYAGGAGTITLAQPLEVALVGAEAITDALTASASGYVNLAFHRDAFAFASRPLADVDGLGNIISQATDPVSGLSLRLEVSRENKQTRFSYDILFGADLVRKQLACRVHG